MAQFSKDNGMKFVFFRHGQTPWNRENRAQGSSNDPVENGLTKEGRENVKLSADMLRDYFYAEGVLPKDIYIYTTPMHRTYDTAKIIQQSFGIPKGNFSIHPELSGRYYGKIEGVKDVKKVKTIARKPKLALSYILSQLGVRKNGNGIETKPDFKERVYDALNDVINDAVDNNAKVVILACNSDIWDTIRKNAEFESVFNLEYKYEVEPGDFITFDVDEDALDLIRELKESGSGELDFA